MHLSLLSFLGCALSSVLASDPVVSSFSNSLLLDKNFDPIKAAYWTGLPHHRRTPFSVSPDGKSAYIAYLDSSYNTVVVQQVDTSTFAAVGTAVEITGYEAAGLVAQDDGFALMATVGATGTTDLPTGNEPIVGLIRYKDGVEAWRTMLNGPGVHVADGLSATPDANGDLVYSEASGLYAAYFVVTAYTGDAAGHFGDSIQYVDDTGSLQTSSVYSSTFGCSHNTGIGLEAADAPPFVSVCAEDQGAIWLNTETRYMSGVKIANENTTNGVSGEPMGGMSGSYSNLALFQNTTSYIFAWQSRGALDLTLNTWMGSPYTQCSPRWLNHNVAVATMSKKDALTGAEASSTVGAAEGDTQVNWITESTTEDHQNVHVATLSSTLSVVSWETLTSPDCQPVPLGCSGTYAGTSFQFVDNTGAKIGSVVSSKSVFVSGDMALVGDKLCWPYVDMTWDLSAPKASGTPVSQMSFACVGTGNSAVSSSAAVVASSSTVSSGVASSAAVLVRSSALLVVTPFTTGPTSAFYGTVSTPHATTSAVASVSSSVKLSTTSASAIITPVKSSASQVTTSDLASSSLVASSALGVDTSLPAVIPSTTGPTSASYSRTASTGKLTSSTGDSAPAITPPASISSATHRRSPTAIGVSASINQSQLNRYSSGRLTTFSTIVKPSPTPSSSTDSSNNNDDECEW